MLENEIVISLGNFQDSKNTKIQNTIKTIESYNGDNIETLLSTCENDNLVKLDREKKDKKREDIDLFKKKKDNFLKFNKCKNVL